MKRVRIRLKRSTIGRIPKHRDTVRALGLKKINSVVEKKINPSIEGMLKSVSYLLDIEEIK